MPVIYCKSCGEKIEYTTQKPEKCPSCGALLSTPASQILIDVNFEQLSASSTSSRRIKQASSVAAIDVDLSVFEQPKKFDDLAKSAPNVDIGERPKIKTQNIFADMMKECSKVEIDE